MTSGSLDIQNLSVAVEGKTVFKNFSLSIPKGEVHALMGPNGTGKSSLAKALAGHPDYTIIEGDVRLNGESILGLGPDVIARKGLFLAFQYPVDIPGLSLANFIRAALQARMDKSQDFVATEYYKTLYEKMDLLGIDRKFTSRSVNVGFSGGEKKRCEVLQMLMLQPLYAILDETDSGLDIDALKVVAQGINLLRASSQAILVITHYQRLLNYIVPDRVHIMLEGGSLQSGPKELAQELEAKGYTWAKEQALTV